MKKKLLATLPILCVLLCIFAFSASAATTLTNDNFVEQITANPAGDYVLGGNITLTAPLCTTEDTAFTGKLDGAGKYTITLKDFSGQSAALFSYVGGGANIHDLTIAGTITGNTGSNNYKGGVAGTVVGSATFENCVNTANITGTQHIGGIVGYVNVSETTSVVKIINCKNTGAISGVKSFIGGIVGRFEIPADNTQTHEITGCTNTGAVKSTGTTGDGNTYYGYTGGIVGILTNGSGSTANATVNVSNCYNSGAISSACTTTNTRDGKYIGGIVGYYRSYAANKNTISDCMNVGAVSSKRESGDACVGGIVGVIHEKTQIITKCYNTGSITATSGIGVGPILGGASVTVTNSVTNNYYYKKTSSNTYDSTVGATAVTTSDYGKKATFKDFSAEYWAFENTGALLKTQLVLDGTIRSAAELKMLMNDSSAWAAGKTYTLACHINLADDAEGALEQAPIGNSSVHFKGTFTATGTNKTISGLDLDGSAQGVALFGYTNGATIEKITVKGTVNSSAEYAAGIVGCARGTTITNCINDVKVESTAGQAGGIVGIVYDDSNASKHATSITGCTNTGDVTATQYAGGIVGDIYNSTADIANVIEITGCTNIGNITVNTGNVAGGIVGYIRPRTVANTTTITIDNCTNGGNIATTATTENHGGFAGGIVGAILSDADTYNLSLTLTNLTNNGTVSAVANQRGSIVGYMRAPLDLSGFTISNCRDEGDNASTAPMMFHVVNGANAATLSISNCYNKNGNAIVYNHTTPVGTVTVSSYPNVKIVLSNCVIAKHITHPNEIRVIMNDETLWDWDFVLTKDVNLNSATNKTTHPQTPIGNSTKKFTGSFNGGSNEISNLEISTSAQGAGLFGYTQDASISNLTVSGTVNSSSSRAGGLVGCAIGDLTVTGCTVNVAVDAENGASAGVVGTIDCGTETGAVNITSTTSKGAVSGTQYMGGIIGYVVGAKDTSITVTGCKNTGNITSTTGGGTGGIIGYLIPSNAVTYTFENCENTGTITGVQYVGGIVGLVGSPTAGDRNNIHYVIDGCTNRGAVSTTTGNVAGGILGYYYNTTSIGTNTITIENSVNYGAITVKEGAGSYVGGIVGLIGGGSANSCHLSTVTISNVANFGVVSGETYRGNVIGTLRHANGTEYDIKDIFGSANTELPLICELGAITDENNLSTFSINGAYGAGHANLISTLHSNTVTKTNCTTTSSFNWELHDLTVNDAQWVMTYDGPRLSDYLNGSKKVVYNIGTQADFIKFTQSPLIWGGDFTLTKDIDLQNTKTTPIGTFENAFTGTFNGNGHTISNLNIDFDKYGAGLFGVVSDDRSNVTEIKNFTLNGSVKTSSRFAGAVIGMICGSAKVSDITNNATISSTFLGMSAGRIGGIVGVITLNNYLTEIRNVQNIVGINNKINVTVENCTNNANIVGLGSNEYAAYSQQRIGGIVGPISPTHEAAKVDNPRGASIITVKGCTNTGNITIEGVAAGGIIGKFESGGNHLNELKVTECSNSGDITSNYKGGYRHWNGAYVGGIVAYVSMVQDDKDISGNVPDPCKSFEISCNYNEGKISAPNAHLIGSVDYKDPPEEDEEDSAVDEGTGEAGTGEGTGDTSTGTTSTTVPSYFKYNAQIGGIVGYSVGGTTVIIEVCKNLNDGEVWSTGNDMGGIIGIANPAYVHDNHNRGKVESTRNTASASGSYGKYIGGIIGRINNQEYCDFEGNYNIGVLTNHHSNDSIVFGVGGGQIYYPDAYSANYYSNALKSTDKNSTYVGADIHLAESFPNLNDRNAWVFTVNNGPELKEFHTHCSVSEYKWVKDADGTYYYGCCNEKIIVSGVTTPVIYVNDDNGNNANAGNTVETAVKTLAEAVKRLSKVSGTVKIVGDYSLASSITFDEWGTTNTITFSSNTPGDAIVISTNAVRLYLGGNAKFEDIAFKGTNSSVRSIVISANFHDLTMKGITASDYAIATITAGEYYPTADDTASTTSTVNLYAVTNGTEAAEHFYYNVYLGSVIQENASTPVKVSNKNITLNTYGETEIRTIRAMSSSLKTNVTGVTTSNCNTTVNLNDNTKISIFRTGETNVNGVNDDTSTVTDRLASLTLNFNGNSHMGMYTNSNGEKVYGTINITNVVNSTVKVSLEKEGRTTPLADRIKFFMNGTVTSEATTATVTYGNHGFDNDITDCIQQGTNTEKLTVTENVTNEHKYSSVGDHPYTGSNGTAGTTTWTKHNDTQHKRTCSCGYVQYSNHNMTITHVAAVAPTCTTDGSTEVIMCTVCSHTTGGETVAALGHVYVWAETTTKGTYNLKCETCDTVITTSTEPVVYVDADGGKNANDGLTPEKAVNTIEEAARRLATTGGKVILCDSYVVSADIVLPRYTSQITFTGLIGENIVGSFNVTADAKIYLGGSTRLDDIRFAGSGRIGFVRWSNHNMSAQ